MPNISLAVSRAIGEAQLASFNQDVETILADFHATRDRTERMRAQNLAQQRLESLNAAVLRAYSMHPPHAWSERYTAALAGLLP